MLKSILRNATDIIGVSEGVLQNWFGENWKNNPKMCVIYNGLDTRPFYCKSSPCWLKKEFGIPQNYKTVVHIGRFHPAKNHIKLVEIAEKYIDINPEVCFILVGDGPVRKEIEALVRTKGLENRFRFAGFRNDVPYIMKASDAFLFPSRWEGLPGTVQEAVAAGLPMVVSDLPGTREILKTCGEGYILAIDAPNERWVESLKKAIDTPNQESWLKQLDASDFSVDIALKKLLAVYRK